jgi:DNA-binding MarR family transcriptional regulator
MAPVPSGLKREIRQTRPFRSLEEEASLGIVRTAAALEHAFGQALKPYDITPTQYNVLRILRGAGPEGLCRHEVGSRLIREVPDVTRLLDRMEDQGLIERARKGRDRRYVTTTITKKGLELVRDLQDTVDGLHRDLLGHMDRAQLRTLVSLLDDARHRG